VVRVESCVDTGAWIITGGTCAGVMKHVGEAVRDYMIKNGARGQVVALGIAAWGCLSNRNTLVDHVRCFVFSRHKIALSFLSIMSTLGLLKVIILIYSPIF